MAALLVTGNPGSGKSSLAQELSRRGLATIDPDYDAAMSYWEDDAGNRVLRHEGPSSPNEQWLRAHHWVWNRTRLEELATQQPGTIFVCGIALNIDRVLDLFDRVFLLQIDADTQEERLRAHDVSHPLERNEAGRQQIRDGRTIFEAQTLELGAIALDGTASIEAVADQLLTLLYGDAEHVQR